MPYEETNGIRTYYETFGEGDPLVLIGGSVFGRRNWAMAWDEFSRHFQVLSYDQRGYGRSDRPAERYTMELWIDDLAALLDALGIDRAHIAGTSMGAMVALAFAAKYPTRCLGVVSDCPLVKPDRMRRMMFETWRRMAHAMGCGDALSDHLVTQAVGPDILDSDRADALIANVREMVATMPVETVIQACLVMEELDLTEAVRRIEAPVLVIASMLDYLCPYRTAASGAGIEYLLNNLTNVKSKIYDDIGHADLLEKKEVSIPLIIDFLKRASMN
jgi:pimeloyl-ACP methyl ester carboxylesterase